MFTINLNVLKCKLSTLDVAIVIWGTNVLGKGPGYWFKNFVTTLTVSGKLIEYRGWSF